jgi:hypothetical protein
MLPFVEQVEAAHATGIIETRSNIGKLAIVTITTFPDKKRNI